MKVVVEIPEGIDEETCAFLTRVVPAQVVRVPRPPGMQTASDLLESIIVRAPPEDPGHARVRLLLEYVKKRPITE